MIETPFSPVRDVALRVAVFVALVFLAWFLSGLLFGMLPVEGSLPRSVLFTFLAGALANTISVRIFEHGQLSDFGLGSGGRRARIANAGLAWIWWPDSLAVRAPPQWWSPPCSHLAGTGSRPRRRIGRIRSDRFRSPPIWRGWRGIDVPWIRFSIAATPARGFRHHPPSRRHLWNRASRQSSLTLVGILNTILWGALLGYACYRTGALWMPIGMHFGWNVLLPLAGANLSGFTIRVVGYALSPTVEGFRSGGAYGPEGSVLTTAAAAALFWLVTRLTREQEGEIA